LPLPGGADTTVTRAAAPSRCHSPGRDTTPAAPGRALLAAESKLPADRIAHTRTHGAGSSLTRATRVGLISPLPISSSHRFLGSLACPVAGWVIGRSRSAPHRDRCEPGASAGTARRAARLRWYLPTLPPPGRCAAPIPGMERAPGTRRIPVWPGLSAAAPSPRSRPGRTAPDRCRGTPLDHASPRLCAGPGGQGDADVCHSRDDLGRRGPGQMAGRIAQGLGGPR
jgi:hypothetical protein